MRDSSVSGLLTQLHSVFQMRAIYTYADQLPSRFSNIVNTFHTTYNLQIMEYCLMYILNNDNVVPTPA